MAEYVNQRIEEMVPELEQMERVGLFSKDEIRTITSKRKIYEYKLRRKQKVKDDYLQYIQYEINLLSLVKKRRERSGYTFKKLEIDVAIVQRIHQLFRIALAKFPEDVKLWLTYIAFAKQRKENSVTSRQYTRMLQVHNKKPELWIVAAKWEFECNNNPDTARNLIQRGLRFNNESKKLWLEYYRLELMYAEKMRKRKALLGDTLREEDVVSDAVLKGQVASVVYANALQTIPDDVNFLISFLPICQKFDFTQEDEKTICETLQERYSDKPVAWDALARRCLGRLKQADENEEDPELQFHQVYEEAVNTVPSDEIWSLYITACLELLEMKASRSLKKKRLQRALLVFEEARDAGYLGAQLFLKWIDVLCDTGSPEKALEVSKAAVESHPKVCDLWHKHLSLMITSGAALDEIQKELKQAKNLLPTKETWPIIKLVLEYAISLNDEETVTLILESAMIARSEVSSPARNLYLHHQYLLHGIEQVRKIFARVQQYKPVSVELYKSYINMELAQPKLKMKSVRSVYNEAVREHGSSHPEEMVFTKINLKNVKKERLNLDIPPGLYCIPPSQPELWLDFIKLEASHPSGKPENVGSIHCRAIKALTGSENQDFIKKYTLLQTTVS